VDLLRGRARIITGQLEPGQTASQQGPVSCPVAGSSEVSPRRGREGRYAKGWRAGPGHGSHATARTTGCSVPEITSGTGLLGIMFSGPGLGRRFEKPRQLHVCGGAARGPRRTSAELEAIRSRAILGGVGRAGRRDGNWPCLNELETSLHEITGPGPIEGGGQGRRRLGSCGARRSPVERIRAQILPASLPGPLRSRGEMRARDQLRLLDAWSRADRPAGAYAQPAARGGKST